MSSVSSADHTLEHGIPGSRLFLSLPKIKRLLSREFFFSLENLISIAILTVQLGPRRKPGGSLNEWIPGE